MEGDASPILLGGVVVVIVVVVVHLVVGSFSNGPARCLVDIVHISKIISRLYGP